MNEITQGLQISISGLTITFLALGVFILIMFVLQKLFPPKPQTEDENGDDQAAGDTYTDIEVSSAGKDNEIAAAIAAAVSYLQSTGQSQLGGTLQEGRGAWWVSNRISSRQSPGQQINRSTK